MFKTVARGAAPTSIHLKLPAEQTRINRRSKELRQLRKTSKILLQAKNMECEFHNSAFVIFRLACAYSTLDWEEEKLSWKTRKERFFGWQHRVTQCRVTLSDRCAVSSSDCTNFGPAESVCTNGSYLLLSSHTIENRLYYRSSGIMHLAHNEAETSSPRSASSPTTRTSHNSPAVTGVWTQWIK